MASPMVPMGQLSQRPLVAQGFLLGRPGSPEQIESLVQSDQTRELGPVTERAASLH